MIIRKPYAFLIKYFKIIHIILFVFMTYLLFQIRSLYTFFQNFLTTGTYVHVANIASKYVNFLMIFMTIILIALLLLIFFLMRQKKKPIFYYLSAIIFYFLAFAFFIYLTGVFNNLEYQTYSNQSLVLYRDFSMVFYYLSFFFLAIAFVRGFGFNVRKFNFEKDLKELDITEADREEIEVGAGFDIDKVSNYVRRKKRNFGYYFKENSFILITLLVVVSLSFIAYFSVNRFVINKIYHEGDELIESNVNYVINNSYLTNLDKYGNYIRNKNTYYVVVDFTVLNNNEENIKLAMENTRLKINKEYYYPKYNATTKFSDLGKFYRSQTLKKGNKYDYLLAFEIENSNPSKEKMILELYVSKKVQNGEAKLHYKEVQLEPYIFEDKNLGNYKLTENIDLKDSYLKKGIFSLTDYKIVDIDNYTYTKCDNSTSDGKCVDYKGSVTPSVTKKLLKISYIPTENKDDLFSYMSVKYQSNGKNKTISNASINNVTPANYPEEGIVFLEVPDEIPSDATLTFSFNLWGGVFTYE